MEQGPYSVLRPMNIADLLDTSLRIYRRHFLPLLLISAVVFVPMGIFRVLAAVFAVSMVETMEYTDNVDFYTMGAAGGMGFFYMLLLLLAVPICQGALAIAVSRIYLNEPISVGEVYGSLKGLWGSLIGVTVLVGLLAGIGVLFCIVPGVYLAILFMFAAPAVAIEKMGAIDAMRRSQKLIEGYWWHCFGAYMLVSVLVMIIAAAIVWPFSLIMGLLMFTTENMVLVQGLNNALEALAQVIMQPVLIIVLVLLYYNLRVRKEGFDLMQMASALGMPQKTAASAEPPYNAPPGSYPDASPADADRSGNEVPPKTDTEVNDR